MMRRILLLTWVGLILPLLWALPVLADEVHLANGDRLTGEIVRMEKGWLLIKTTYAGEVKLKWQEVLCITSDRELTFRLKDGAIWIGQADCPASGTIQIETESTDESAELSLDELDAINPSPPPPAVTYKGNIAGGGNVSRGNTDETAANASAGFEARSKRHRLTLAGRYNYGQTDGEITTRNALGRIKYDLFLWKKIYTYSHARFERDDFQDISLRSIMGLGLGYQILDTERISLFAEAGASYFNVDYIEARDEDYIAARESLSFNLDIIPKRLKFFHLHELYYSLDESKTYLLSSEQGFRLLLFRNFFAKLQVDFDYNSNPAPGKEKADISYIGSLGYEFTF
jgi:putative salt-induced outer membrane protein YdiY